MSPWARKIAGGRRRISTALARLTLNSDSIRVGRNVTFDGMPIVTGAEKGVITIGDRCFLISRPSGTALGVRGPVILRLLNRGASIRIGADTGISGAVICSAVSVSVGARCLIGADVMIFDTDFHDVERIDRRYAPPPWEKISKPVDIGDDVFVGARSTVLKGVTIGSGSVIGAGSVVGNDIPPRMLAAGVPARVIRRLSTAEPVVSER